MKRVQNWITLLAFGAAAVVATVAHQTQAAPWSDWGNRKTATTCYTDTNLPWGPGHSVLNGNNYSSVIGWCDNYECGPGGYVVFQGCDNGNNCETLESYGGSVSTTTLGPAHTRHRCMVLGVAGATW